MQTKFTDKEFTPQSPATYKQQCDNIENATTINKDYQEELKTTYRIKRKKRSICEIPDFYITCQLDQDIMHVLFEDIVKYELCLVLMHFISNGINYC